MIRTIIIDDEPLATESLALVLKKKCPDDVQVVATSNSSKDGKALIEELQPDLLFLDIEMPGMNGIKLLRSFSKPTFHVVFVTAHDTYALEALRLSAMDYLLKPIDAEEIMGVIDKVKNEMTKNESSLEIRLRQLEKLMTKNSTSAESKIGIGMADKIVFINISDILYCEASGVYTNIYLNDGKKITASKPLGDFESQLSGHRFFRIHHSTLINLKHIKEFQRLNGGYVLMQNGEKLEVSHRKRKDFLDAIDDFII